MSSNSWETELNSECASDRPDADKVRQLCREHGVPAELRGKIWQVLFRVAKTQCDIVFLFCCRNGRFYWVCVIKMQI
jgi:hypothetical protein